MLQLTCRLLGLFLKGGSCMPGSWGSCSILACTCRSARPRSPPDTGIGPCPRDTDPPHCPRGDICTSYTRCAGHSSRPPAHSAHRPRPRSGGDTHTAPCPGHTRGQAQSRGRTPDTQSMRCPSSPADRRSTGARPPPACTRTDQSHRHSRCARSPLGHSHTWSSLGLR